jgi:thiol:disulfide interchange protein DsbG
MTFKFLLKLFYTVVMTAGFFLAGCNESPGTGGSEKSEKTASRPISMGAMAAQATGFTVGSKISAHTVYVFLMPNALTVAHYGMPPNR